MNNIMSYQEKWDQLFNNGDYQPSVSFAWTYSLLVTHLDPQKDSYILLIVKDSEEVIGFIPLIVSQSKKFGFDITNLFPVSEYYNTHSDFLLTEINEEIFGNIISTLFRLKTKWDVFRIKRVLETSPKFHLIENGFHISSLKYITQREEPSFFSELGETYDSYLTNRSSKFRNYLKRMDKKMRSYGEIKILIHKDFKNIIEAYDQILQIEKTSWKDSHGTAITSVFKQEDFYKELCERTLKNDLLHLIFLYMNNEPIAYNMGLVKNRTYFYLKTSFSETFRKCSPSTILRAELIRRLIEEDIQYFDFPGEPYEWEQQWAEKNRWHKSYKIFNKTYKGNLLYVYYNLKKKIKPHKDSNDFRWHDPLDVKPE